MRHLTIALFGALALSACNSTSPYNTQNPRSNFGVGFGAGTTGATIEAKYAPSTAVMLRGSYNYLDFSSHQDIDGIDYDGEFQASTVAGFVDVSPFRNGFVVSGGAYIGDKTLTLDATPTEDVEIGGQMFTPEEVGMLRGQARLNKFAPYAGIGYDGFIRGSKDWTFNARAGVMFTGSVDAELISANGTLSSNPLLRDELDNEVREIEKDIESFRYYPVVTVGVTRRF